MKTSSDDSCSVEGGGRGQLWDMWVVCSPQTFLLFIRFLHQVGRKVAFCHGTQRAAGPLGWGWGGGLTGKLCLAIFNSWDSTWLMVFLDPLATRKPGAGLVSDHPIRTAPNAPKLFMRPALCAVYHNTGILKRIRNVR